MVMPIKNRPLKLTPFGATSNLQLQTLKNDSYAISKRIQEMNLRRIDRETHYSLLDPLLNLKAQDRLARGKWYEENEAWEGVAKVVDGYLDIGKRLWNLKDPVTMLITTLRVLGDTLDAPSLLIKAPIVAHLEGIGLSESYKNAFGLGDRGRENYWFERINEGIEWLPDHWAINLAGEILIDPMNWISLGAGVLPGKAIGKQKLLAKRIARYSVDDAGKVTKESLEFMSEMLSKLYKDSIPQPILDTVSKFTIVNAVNADEIFLGQAKIMKRLSKMVWRGEKDDFAKALYSYNRGGYFKGMERSEMLELFEASSTELGAKSGYRFLYAMDKLETNVIKTIGKTTPAGQMVKQSVKFYNWRKSGGLKTFKELGETVEAQKAFKLKDYDHITVEELEVTVKNYETQFKEMKTAYDISDEEYSIISEQYASARWQLAQKKAFDKNKDITIQINNNNNEVVTITKRMENYKYSTIYKRFREDEARLLDLQIELRDLKEAREAYLETINTTVAATVNTKHTSKVLLADEKRNKITTIIRGYTKKYAETLNDLENLKIKEKEIMREFMASVANSRATRRHVKKIRPHNIIMEELNSTRKLINRYTINLEDLDFTLNKYKSDGRVAKKYANMVMELNSKERLEVKRAAQKTLEDPLEDVFRVTKEEIALRKEFETNIAYDELLLDRKRIMALTQQSKNLENSKYTMTTIRDKFRKLRVRAKNPSLFVDSVKHLDELDSVQAKIDILKIKRNLLDLKDPVNKKIYGELNKQINDLQTTIDTILEIKDILEMVQRGGPQANVIVNTMLLKQNLGVAKMMKDYAASALHKYQSFVKRTKVELEDALEILQAKVKKTGNTLEQLGIKDVELIDEYASKVRLLDSFDRVFSKSEGYQKFLTREEHIFAAELTGKVAKLQEGRFGVLRDSLIAFNKKTVGDTEQFRKEHGVEIEILEGKIDKLKKEIKKLKGKKGNQTYAIEEKTYKLLANEKQLEAIRDKATVQNYKLFKDGIAKAIIADPIMAKLFNTFNTFSGTMDKLQFGAGSVSVFTDFTKMKVYIGEQIKDSAEFHKIREQFKAFLARETSTLAAEETLLATKEFAVYSDFIKGKSPIGKTMNEFMNKLFGDLNINNKVAVMLDWIKLIQDDVVYHTEVIKMDYLIKVLEDTPLFEPKSLEELKELQNIAFETADADLLLKTHKELTNFRKDLSNVRFLNTEVRADIAFNRTQAAKAELTIKRLEKKIRDLKILEEKKPLQKQIKEQTRLVAKYEHLMKHPKLNFDGEIPKDSYEYFLNKYKNNPNNNLERLLELETVQYQLAINELKEFQKVLNKGTPLNLTNDKTGLVQGLAIKLENLLTITNETTIKIPNDPDFLITFMENANSSIRRKLYRTIDLHWGNAKGFDKDLQTFDFLWKQCNGNANKLTSKVDKQTYWRIYDDILMAMEGNKEVFDKYSVIRLAKQANESAVDAFMKVGAGAIEEDLIYPILKAMMQQTEYKAIYSMMKNIYLSSMLGDPAIVHLVNVMNVDIVYPLLAMQGDLKMTDKMAKALFDNNIIPVGSDIQKIDQYLELKLTYILDGLRKSDERLAALKTNINKFLDTPEDEIRTLSPFNKILKYTKYGNHPNHIFNNVFMNLDDVDELGNIVVKNIDGTDYIGDLDLSKARYHFIDFETQQAIKYDADSIEPWQVSVVTKEWDAVNEDWISNRQTMYLKMDQDLSEVAQRYSNISKKAYKNGRVELQEGIQKIFQNLGENDIFVAHNADFDREFLRRASKDYGIQADIPILDSLPFLRMSYSHYEGINKINFANYKQETIAKRFLGENYLTELSNKFQQELRLSKVSFHNAQYDSQILADIMLGPSKEFLPDGTLIKKTDGLFLSALKHNNIQNLTDLNKSSVTFFNSAQLKEVPVITERMTKSIDRFLDLRRGTQSGHNVEDYINMDFDKIIDYIKGINKAIEDPQNLKLKSFKNGLYDLNEELGRIDLNRAKYNTDEMADIFCPDYIDDMIEEVNTYKNALEVLEAQAKRKDDKILNAIYGDGMADITMSKIVGHVHVLDAYNEATSVHKLMRVIQGKLDAKDIGGPFTKLADKYRYYIRTNVDTHLAKHPEIAKPTNYNDYVKRYRQYSEPNPITKMLDVYDDINEYYGVQSKIFEQLWETYQTPKYYGTYEGKLMFHKMYDFMQRVDTRYYRFTKFNDEATSLMSPVKNIEEFRFAIMNEFKNSDINKFITDPRASKQTASYVEYDPIGVYIDYVMKRVKKDIAASVSKPHRLMLNPDSGFSTQFYNTFKDNMIDVSYVEEVSPTTRLVGKGANQTQDDESVLAATQLYDTIKNLVDEATESLRAPLRTIKTEGSNKSVHVGSLRKHLAEQLELSKTTEGVTDELGGYKFLMRGEYESVSHGSYYQAKYTGLTKENNAKARLVNSVLYGISDDLTEMAQKFTTDMINPYKDSKPTNDFFNAMSKLSEKLGIDVYDFGEYVVRNSKDNVRQLYQSQIIDNLMHLDTDGTFKQIFHALEELQKWAEDPMTSYLKTTDKAGVVISEEAIATFMRRLKSSIMDTIDDQPGTEIRKALSKLYDEDVSKKQLYKTLDKPMHDVTKYMGKTYSEFRRQFSDPKEMLHVLKTSFSDYKIVGVVKDPTSRTGWRIKPMRINTVADIAKVDRLFAMVDTSKYIGADIPIVPIGFVDDHTLQVLEKLLQQKFKFREDGALDALRRLIVMPMKSMMLLTANFAFNNVVDINVKNLIAQEGGIFSPQSVIGDIVSAGKMHKRWNELYHDAAEVISYGTYQHKYKYMWPDAYREYLKYNKKLTPELEVDLVQVKFVNDFVNTPAAASEISDMMLRVQDNVIGKGSQKISDQFINKVFYGSRISPFVINMQMNGYMETIGRLALHINDLKKGLTKNESLVKILKTHFNYANKTKAEMYMEFFIPFVSYPVRNFVYWQDALYKNATDTKVLVDAIMFSWGHEHLTQNDYAQYQASRGHIAMGEHAIQTGLTFMESLGVPSMGGQYSPGIPDQMARKMNPVIKGFAFQEGRNTVETMNRMPMFSQANNIQGAFAGGGLNLDTQFPSVSSPFFSQGFPTRRQNTAYRHPMSSKPYRFYGEQLRFRGNFNFDSGAMDKLRYKTLGR